MDPKNHPATTVTNIRCFIPFTLEMENGQYTSWAELFRIHCSAFQVGNHIDSSFKPPSATPSSATATEADKTKAAAEFETWSRLDAIVLQWIYGTISNDLLHTILKPNTTASQAWSALENIFQDNQSTNSKFVSTRLDQHPNISSYCQAMNMIADRLANVGNPVSNQHLVLQVIAGLNESYEGLAMLIQQTTPLLVLSGKSASEKKLAKSLKESLSFKLADDVKIQTLLHSEMEKQSEKNEFDINTYMGSLRTTCFGRLVLWSPRLSSTQDLVSSNFGEIPMGSVCIADVQFKGRGNLLNFWQSPDGKGSLLFSFTIQMKAFRVVPLLQYVVCLAMTEAIKDLGLRNGMLPLDVRIRWPSDFYLNDLKVGGTLCTSTYRYRNFNISAGVGLNVDNDKPTTCLNSVLKKLSSGYQLRREDITSAFFNKFERFFHVLMNQGFQPLEELYYKTWLHSGQRIIVHEEQDLATEKVVTIQGLTSSGNLLAIADNGEICELRPHGNSFDFFEGLVSEKLA